jgi:hypothetical protein
MVVCIILWTILAIANVVAFLNCQYIQDPKTNLFITIGNLAKLGTPLILPLVRLKDPSLQTKIFKKKKVSVNNINGSENNSFASDVSMATVISMNDQNRTQSN